MSNRNNQLCRLLGIEGATSTRSLARRLLDLAEDHPEDALGLIEELLAAEQSAATRVVAHRVRGVAYRLTGDNTASLSELRLAVDIGSAAGLVEETELARASLAGAFFIEGQVELGFSVLDEAISELSGIARAEARFQRGTMMARLGNASEALADFGKALPPLSRHGPARVAGHLRGNRGLVFLQLGQIASAIREFEIAESIYRREEILGPAGLMQQNRALAEAARGDYVRALATGQAAVATLESAGRPTEVALLDRCEMFLSLGLAEDAYLEACEAIRVLEESGSEASVTEGLVVLCRAASESGRHREAARLAEETADRFGEYGNDDWAHFRDLVALDSAVAERSLTAAEVSHADDMANEFAIAGHWSYECRARVLAAIGALELGQHRRAGNMLDALPGVQPPGVQIDRNYAAARLAQEAGLGDQALDAVRSGLRIADENRLAIGASEARAASLQRTGDLVELGTDLLHPAPTRQALFVEHHRTVSMEALPARQDDSELAAALSDYRQGGSLGPGKAPRTDQDREAELAQLRRIRRLSLARSGEHDRRLPRLTLVEIRRRIGTGAAVVVFAAGSTVYGCTITQKSVERKEIGRLEDLREELESGLFWLRRLADGWVDRSDEVDVVAIVTASFDALAARFRALVPDGATSIVFCPPNWLLSLPGAAIQERWGVPVVVAPSLTRWCHAAQGRRRRSHAGTVAVAGPGLPEAETEAIQIGRVYEQSQVLVGDDANFDAVLRALDGSLVAHIGCHGHFRSDNPMFSSVQLADGPFMAYDLERLRRPPDVVVLSSCDVGRSRSLPGDEILGMTTAFVTGGTRSVIASVLPVPDSTVTRALMVDLHKNLEAGRRPAVALFDAASSMGNSVEELIVRNLYSCFAWG